MRYTSLGTTGLSVSRLCLGCMSYGASAWRPWVLDEDAARPFFRRAIEAGINFFDTADMYSLGVSEEVTGRALRDYGRPDELVIATKVFFPLSDRPNMGGLSRKHIVQGCEASLRRLGVETIDLYQIHRFDPVVPIEETLAALDHLVHSGKVRYIGASSGFAWQFAQALSASERHGWARFVSMQNHYNLLYREEEREMIPLCAKTGVGLMPWSPLARGLLAGARRGVTDRESTVRAATDSYGHGLYDDQVNWDIVDAVRRVADGRGVPMAQIALAWLLSRPQVAAPIVGATKLPQLEDALGAVSLELSAEEVALLEAPYRPQPVRGIV
ncbi:MAG: aldo/keto reductase [Gemmatimonas sp.]|jgi:aryl-alcohol dehydrogenase-like predicted oxidoreductase|uniref:aldo/keto reductase n=1 Tax=Gemmatimonas sp. TaxID=1962908 RepID=UPI0022C952B0|nr:aldo/keto reductase [Gemmatimonas sp.]MCA2985313.1 aldo/keto reductase [Gemmatimonas sp.]MCA2986355.1 aldo/keto reductase [Gemmatimonas sp.]MCA2993524.1 aldo/keto reductase [Gemmatimonas sp.]MCE2954240.1 aldo/keto reductase [Gemmatimonas sp.]MCZ8011562.1 aldo/keto reductase [Gemmatimonas sp.]